jgi:ubiquinone/menaquinone biosynthesis C-methylase UbiE
MKENLNENLYRTHLFNEWANMGDFDLIEKYYLKKYIVHPNKKIIEAGTGGGRIIFYLEKQGFLNLNAFDYVPKMIAYCETKKTNINSKVKFKVANAVNLIEYQNNTFDYLIYMQQVLCFVNKELFIKSLKEAYRIGNTESIYIFTFLNWNAKLYNPILSFFVNIFRLLRNEKTFKYYLPWLKIEGKFNKKLFNANQPSNFWIKKKKILKILKNVGFKIVEINTEDKIYIVCKKF